MKPIILEMPNSVKEVQIKDKIYELNTDDLELCRKIQELNEGADIIVNGKIPNDKQINDILGKCKNIIDMALGIGVYEEITKEEQGKRRYLLPLYIVGQLKDICNKTEQDYIISRYSKERIAPDINPEQYINLLSAISNLPETIEKLQAMVEKNGN